jgi:hypothetical protein
MESCPPSFGTLPVIAWTAARDQMERCPPSARNGARDGVEYADMVFTAAQAAQKSSIA